MLKNFVKIKYLNFSKGDGVYFRYESEGCECISGTGFSFEDVTTVKDHYYFSIFTIRSQFENRTWLPM